MAQPSPQPPSRVKTPAASSPSPSPASVRVPAAWLSNGPLLARAFAAVRAPIASSSAPGGPEVEATSPTPLTSPATPLGAYTALAQTLVNTHHAGVFKQLQQELPTLLAETGRPLTTLARLLTSLPPRVYAPKNNNAARTNAGSNRNTPLKAASPGANSCVEPEAALVAEPAAASSAAEAPSTWFTQLVTSAYPTGSFITIGTSNAHVLQTLLLASVVPLLTNGLAPSVDEQALVRDTLLPLWLTTPSVFATLLTTFNLAADLTWSEHEVYVLALLRGGHAAAALAYLVHFDLADHADPVPLLTIMLQPNAPHGAEQQAVELARTYPQFRVPLINLLTTVAHKSALSMKLIEKYGLVASDFPVVVNDVRYKQLKWLVREDKGEELGPEVCGSDLDLQRTLVKCLVKASDAVTARLMLDIFGIQEDERLLELIRDLEVRLLASPPPPRPAVASVDYMRLPADVPVIMVDSTPGSLDAAERGLTEATIVGLDVEFGFTGTTSNQPALLQISTRTTAFLFDLLVFETTPRMGQILSNLFRNPSILKVGYAWDGDWRILRAGFPQAECFKHQTQVIDMADPARAMDREERMAADKERKERRKREAEAAAAAGLTLEPEPSTATPAQQVVSLGGEDEILPEEDEMEDAEAEADDPTEEPTSEPVDEPMSDVASSTADASASSSAPCAAIGSPARIVRRREKKLSKRAARRVSKGGAASAPSEDGDESPKGVAKGLSALCALLLGRPLDKTFQISAWRRRPLKEAQVQYAALDAWCLIGIHDAFFGDTALSAIKQLNLPHHDTYIQINECPPTSSSPALAPIDPVLAAWIQTLPKVELHAHLSGSVREATVLQLLHEEAAALALANGSSAVGPLATASEVSTFRFGDRTLSECFDVFRILHRLLASLEAVSRVTREVVADFARENTAYLELRTTPRALPAKGGRAATDRRQYVEAVVAAIRECEQTVRTPSGERIIVRLLLSIDRSQSFEDAEATLALASEFAAHSNPIVVGVDFSGNPSVGSFRALMPLFERARATTGLKATIHVGEKIGDGDDLDAALFEFKPERLGHVVCLEPRHVAFLQANPIPIEICPTSNLKTQIVREWHEHPFGDWKKLPGQAAAQTASSSSAPSLSSAPVACAHPYPLIVCTDDSGVFNITLTSELAQLAATFTMGRAELFDLERRAVEYAFADEQAKREVRAIFARFEVKEAAAR